MLNHLTSGPSPRHPQHDDGRNPAVLEAAPLLATLRSLGRERFCLRYDERAWLLPPTEKAAEQANRELEDFVGHYLLFDEHADWGVLCDWDATVSIVGGNQNFVETYLRHACGENALHRRLVQFDFGLKWGDAMRPWSDEYRVALYQAFGWEVPPYPNQGEVFGRQPSEDEFRNIWQPVFDRLALEGNLSAPSIPPGWRAFPFRGHVVTEGGGLFEFGIIDPHPKLEEYDALLFVLTSADRWELCIAALDHAHSPQSVRIVAPKVWALNIPDFAGRPVAMIDSQGDWLLVSLAEGVSFMAGEPDIAARVLDRAGGETNVRARFEEWAATAQVPSECLDELRQRAGWA